jgi:hypothetical protein
MHRIEKLKTVVMATRQAMRELGWDRLDFDRDEPSFESVCYVATDALSRHELAHLSIKGACQVSLFVEYLSKFVSRRKADTGGGSVPERDKLRAYFCATELFNSMLSLSAGGNWHGVGEDMWDGRGSPDDALHEWMHDSVYFAEEAAEADVGLDEIVCALRPKAIAKGGARFSAAAIKLTTFAEVV